MFDIRWIRDEAFDAAVSRALYSPPPCGEGSGVGVASREAHAVERHARTLIPRVFTPPLTPPRQGERDRACGTPGAFTAAARDR